jgi:hypothetical protein
MNRRAILFTLWTLQGALAFSWLVTLPADAKNSFFLGFSAARLALIGILLALTAFSAVLAWFARRADFSLSPRLQDRLYLLALLVAVAAPLALLTLRALGQTSRFIYTAYAQRLTPLVFWLSLAALEFIVYHLWGKFRATFNILRVLRLSLYAFLCLAAIAAFMVVTHLGLTPYNDGSWGAPATPLLEWQIALALIIGLAAILLAPKIKLSDSKVAFLVYLLTCFLWLTQPLKPGFFATPPRAPNFEIYPFSDALIYAQYAQSALIGNGFLWPDVPTRPLYIAFLTWLHALAGQDYTHIIFLQTLVLAAFPATLYLLGKELAGRPLGLGLALLAAFRDLTANVAAPFASNYTYSKLFFSEIPAALLLSIFALMIIRWLRQTKTAEAEHRHSKSAWYPLLAGGILGLSALIRLQSVVLLAAVIPIGFFVIKNRRKWLLGSALMMLGVALALIPWLARNLRATGGLVVDNPISQTMVLARRWGGDNGNELIPRLPDEGDAQYSSRMTGLALQSLRQNPGRILGSALNHFFNNEIGNLLVFPLRDRLDSPAELLWPQHPFWQTWRSHPSAGQIPVIWLYLLVFAVGLGAAWHKNGPLGLLPLALTLVYNAWTALFLSSGDRFLVPVDWAVYLYHFLGLLTFASLLLTGLKGARENVVDWVSARYNGRQAGFESAPVSWRGLFLTSAIILFLGASIPLTEVIFPKISPLKETSLTPQTGEILLRGRAIYPRYYDAGDGEPGTAKLGYGQAGEARLVFFLLGEQDTLVIFPLEHAPEFFPNTSDVAILGTRESGFVRARKILVEKDGTSKLISTLH